jgi:CHAT domain-containing protein
VRRASGLGLDDPLKSTIGSNLAVSLYADGRFREALPLLRDTCAQVGARSKRLALEDAPHHVSQDTADAISCQRVLAATLSRTAESGDATGQYQLRSDAFLEAQKAGSGQAERSIARAAARGVAQRRGQGDLVRRWEDLLHQIQALDSRFGRLAASGRAADTSLIAKDSETRDGLRRELANAESRLQGALPEFFDLFIPEPIPVSALQSRSGPSARMLHDDEALVLIMSGTSYFRPPNIKEFPCLIFVVTKERFVSTVINVRGGELEGWIKDLRSSAEVAVRDQAGQGTGPSGYPRVIAKKLYDAIFGAPEIAAALRDKPNWLIVPQWMFVGLPYAALVVDAPAGRDDDPLALKSTHWLGLEKAITILPSVNSLRVLRGDRTPSDKGSAFASTSPNNRFLGFGDPDFARDGTSCSANTAVEFRGAEKAETYFRDGSVSLDAVRRLPRLPETCLEIKAVAQTFQAPEQNIVLGPGATEKNVREHPRLASARVLEFATHALISGDFGGGSAEPALALTPPANVGTTENDGLLTGSEITQLRLGADWFVLSACNTAAPGTRYGEGLSGLARAFFFAGARSLFVSQWRVTDRAAAFLITHTVEHQDKLGIGRAKALQMAMREFLDSPDAMASNPGLWASFIFVGAD